MKELHGRHLSASESNPYRALSNKSSWKYWCRGARHEDHGYSYTLLSGAKKFPHAEATAMSSGADDVLQDAHVVNDLEEALQGVKLAVGLSARRRELTQPYLDVREVAHEMMHVAEQADVAFVFGTEMSGLSNLEIHQCQLLSFIDANPDYSSLNLAQAVQVLCHELRQASISRSPPKLYTKDLTLLANHDSLMGFLSHLKVVLEAVEFLDKVQGDRLMQRLHILLRDRIWKSTRSIFCAAS